MVNKKELLQKFEKLVRNKKSKGWYAEKLGITPDEVEELRQELKGGKTSQEFDRVFKEDVKAGTAEISFDVKNEIKTLDELIDKCNIDTDKWNIDRYVQNYWGNGSNPRWQVKAWLSVKKEEVKFQENFTEFLKTYNPSWDTIRKICDSPVLPNACLVINKQDEHLNKYDVDGDNNITTRFSNTYDNVKIILNKAALSNNLDKIIYILGSDEFNSEWTGLTTKGTPQQNLMSYEKSFELICNYEVAMIKLLLTFGKNVEVKYVQGNHDEFVGWHLINWLKSAFKGDSSLVFDDSMECTKCIKYSNTAMMFNHGDAIKPLKLAVMFPQLFKDDWSSCDFFYIFTGDKHHEKSEDLGGIIFYQIPALSKAKSKWDKKNGHVLSRAELTAFLIEEKIGRTDIMKRPL